MNTEGIALAMVVDVSGSMGAVNDFQWDDQKITRLEGVKKVFRLFIEGGQAPDGSTLPGRPQDLVSIVKYHSFPETACPLTLDHAVLFKILKDLRPATAVEGGQSNPGDALALALIGLRKASVKRKVIIFLTDGESNVDKPALRPRQAAQLAELDIPIYAIDAIPDSNTGEESEKPARTCKRRRHYERTLFQGQQRPGPDRGLRPDRSAGTLAHRFAFEYSKYYDGFLWFALAGLACWLNVVFLEATLWRKVP